MIRRKQQDLFEVRREAYARALRYVGYTEGSIDIVLLKEVGYFLDGEDKEELKDEEDAVGDPRVRRTTFAWGYGSSLNGNS